MIGCCDDPDIGSEFLVRSQRREFSALKNVEHLRLQCHGHITDFIEEENALVRGLKFSGTFLVTKFFVDLEDSAYKF
jgi:hypothetical protein